MQILVNTDSTVQGSDELTLRVEQIVREALKHASDRITRVEIHLNDENSGKGGADDKRCAMEARPEGLKPIAVRHQAGTLDLAIEGAAAKLRSAVQSAFGRLRDR